jgi:hypothetical protein
MNDLDRAKEWLAYWSHHRCDEAHRDDAPALAELIAEVRKETIAGLLGPVEGAGGTGGVISEETIGDHEVRAEPSRWGWCGSCDEKARPCSHHRDSWKLRRRGNE